MTLRSRKKRQITAQTFSLATQPKASPGKRDGAFARRLNQVKRRAMAILISSALLGPSLVGWDAPVHAQQPALSIVSTTSNPGWNLRWRRSPNVQAPPAGASQPAIAAPAQPAIASSRRLASTAVPTATVPVTTNAATSNTLQFRRPAFAAPQATGQIALASDQSPFHANAVAQQGQWVGDSSMVATAEFVQPTHLEAPVNPIRQVQDQQVATGK